MSKQLLSAALAQIVRAELAARDIKAAELARLLDQPKATVWRRVTGEIPMDTDDLDNFAAALKMSPEELVRRAIEVRDAGQVWPTAAQHRKSARKGEDDNFDPA